MPEHGEVIRQQIVDAANRLFYRRGYNQTSFSEIAEACDIPRGNFYYYFKTKDEILSAVIADRIERIRAMLAEWDGASDDPHKRLRRFVQMLRDSDKDLARYGCPMGSLNIELGKAQPRLKAMARKMFDLFRDWLTVQLKSLGRKNAAELALHLLGRAQGVAVVAHAYGDREYLEKELDQLEIWVEKQTS